MNQFSRRNILKALLAAPALSALRPLASAQPGPLTVDGLMTLNILFHGPFSFVIYDNRVEVLTPHQDDHTYRFWGVDPPPNPYPHLPAGTHFVQGLKGEKTAPPLDRTSSVVVDAKIVKTVGVKGKTHCKIILPLPQSLRPVCVVKVKKAIFKGKHSDFANQVAYIPMTQALVYSIADVSSLAVYGLPDWRPEPNPKKPSTANLHFEVFPIDADVDGKHTRRAFTNQVTLLEGLDLGLDQHGDTEDPTEVTPFPDGVEGYVCPPEHDEAHRSKRAYNRIPAGLPVHCRAPSLIVTK